MGSSQSVHLCQGPETSLPLTTGFPIMIIWQPLYLRGGLPLPYVLALEIDGFLPCKAVTS